jgi:hypothetical protein
VAGLPSRFWVQNSETEIEYVGQVDANWLTNLGTVERTRRGFKVTANSVRRAACLTAVVADAVAAAGRVGKVTSQSARTADEMLGESDADDAPDGREAMCRRLGLGAALTAVPPCELTLEEHFLPVEHPAVGEAVVREINRELGIRSMLAARSYGGRTAPEAVAAGGEARDSVLAMIDDCESRLARAEAEASRDHQPVLIVTANEIPGFRIAQVHGNVFGLIVRVRNYFSNLGASFRTPGPARKGAARRGAEPRS